MTKNPAAPTPLTTLPDPRHAQRIPPHLGPEAWARLRQSAHLLPQVLRPADLDLDEDGSQDARLDALGLVQLQKAVSGARPSRWIAPEAMEAALAHLDAVGSGPKARPVMLERGATLEGLGLVRHAGRWTREATQMLQLAEPGWQVAVAFRLPVDETPVWAFYRDGDAAALQQALDPLPPWPHVAELTAYLDGLVERSREFKPHHLASLLPRLQAECAAPRTLAELRQGCSRAQDRWEHLVAELDTMVRLNEELAFQGYPDTFETARRLQRSVTLYVGPPNSGKTHAAFERLAQALEGRDRLVARGVPCSLLTGEENVPAPGARVVSSTIEMVNTRQAIDAAVIDEAQMIFDNSRGWAWTQAIVAVPALTEGA
jgi:ATP-dependent RNA helicase SUPV3L1/SUV3